MAYYFIFSKTDLLLKRQADGTHTIPCSDDVPVKTHPWTHVMSVSPMEDGTEVYTFKVENPMQIEVLSESLKRDGYDFIGLRESFYHLPTELYLKAGKCQELLYWDFNTQY